jgi:iron-sulfur cluster repair protein YtfE (RIC family)
MKELSLTTALRHRELRPDLERLRQWADEIGVVHIDTVRHRLGAANELLMTRLLPHALAEDEILYPAVRKFVGAQAIEMLQRDHGEMLKLTAELNALRRAASADEVGPRFAVEARRILYGLFMLADLHFAKEDEIVLPVLDARCTLVETADLTSAMEHAAARINAEA